MTNLKMKLCREHMDYISSTVAALDSYISELSKPYEDLISFAADVPGITENSARYIIAEIGVDMTVFKSAKHLTFVPGPVLPLRITKVPVKRKLPESQEPVSI